MKILKLNMKLNFFSPKAPISEAGFETKFSKVCHQRAVFTLNYSSIAIEYENFETETEFETENFI